MHNKASYLAIVCAMKIGTIWISTNGDTTMKRTTKLMIALITLLAVSACANPNARDQAFQNYDYSLDTASTYDNQLLIINGGY